MQSVLCSVAQCGSVGACMYRSSSRLLTPLPSVRLRSLAFPLPLFLTAVVRGREGGRGHGACVDVSGGGRIRTINHQREFARWISLSLVAPPPPPPLASRLVEEGKRGSCLLPWQLYHATETQGSTERERRSLARSLAPPLPPPPSSASSFPSSPARSLAPSSSAPVVGEKLELLKSVL